ncbi:MAG: hypothetical protein PHV74_12940 [Dehalococcoidia bacterium]|nr:hypothetical protein [Dehalococcoidia bacterium]
MAKYKQQYKPLDLSNITRRRHPGEKVLPPPCVLSHIVQVVSHIEYHIEAADCLKAWPILERAFGLNLGIRGGPLLDALCHLAETGRIAAYHANGGKNPLDTHDLCFCGRTKFERWCEADHELRLRQERFISPGGGGCSKYR